MDTGTLKHPKASTFSLHLRTEILDLLGIRGRLHSGEGSDSFWQVSLWPLVGLKETSGLCGTQGLWDLGMTSLEPI